MNDRMYPPEFGDLLIKVMQDYEAHHCFLGVPVLRQDNDFISPLGPAAGPHTQLAGNLIAAFGAGANHFEFKTVQILEGEALTIKKPCIYSAHEVYNSEWSTELRVEEAADEYIKAYLINYVLAIEYKLVDPKSLHYIMSVGYDLEGIKSPLVNGFIEVMKDGTKSQVWATYIDYIKDHLDLFHTLTEEDVAQIPSEITSTVALSTMHGCDKEEIEKIATYLMEEKDLSTFIKMNPTLLGKELVWQTLKDFDYRQLEVKAEVFDEDLTFDEAIPMIERLMDLAKGLDQVFGVKLTNTLPVINKDTPLEDEQIYLSGPALYPLSIQVALKLAQAFRGQLPISYSGGADKHNIEALVAAGMFPVTVSSVLLKPGGYKNIGAMNKVLMASELSQSLHDHHSRLPEMAQMIEQAKSDHYYHHKALKTFERSEDYSPLCSVCNNCVDTCPNRANEKVKVDGHSYVIHYDDLCNECGNCSCYCIKGHDPYKEKWTTKNYSTFSSDQLRKT